MVLGGRFNGGWWLVFGRRRKWSPTPLLPFTINYEPFTIREAHFSAATKLVSLAIPLPAISNAVP